jgi:hypothetical protein
MSPVHIVAFHFSKIYFEITPAFNYSFHKLSFSLKFHKQNFTCIYCFNTISNIKKKKQKPEKQKNLALEFVVCGKKLPCRSSVSIQPFEKGVSVQRKSQTVLKFKRIQLLLRHNILNKTKCIINHSAPRDKVSEHKI